MLGQLGLKASGLALSYVSLRLSAWREEGQLIHPAQSPLQDYDREPLV